MRRRYVVLAVAVIVLVGSACAVPLPPTPGPAVKLCDWRASILSIARYSAAPWTPKVVAAEVGSHTKWRTSGWDPDCLGISVYDMRAGYQVAPWNRCYYNRLVQSTKLFNCYETVAPPGVESMRAMLGNFSAAGHSFTMGAYTYQHARAASRRPVMYCYVGGIVPAGTSLSCPWTVIVPGRGPESGA